MTTLFVPAADAAPYPPTEPCSVTTADRATVGTDGVAQVVVVGSGLGAQQRVRVVQTTTQQTLAWTRTDTDGRFRTVVRTPTGPEGAVPQLSAASASATCTTPRPPDPAPSTTTRPGGPGTGSSGSSGNGGGPGNGGSGGASGGNGSGGNGSGGNGGTGGPQPQPIPGSASGSGAPTAPGSSADASSTPDAPSSTAGTSLPPRADAPRSSDTPFTLGLAIAAALLVLGTLLVLLLARRPSGD